MSDLREKVAAAISDTERERSVLYLEWTGNTFAEVDPDKRIRQADAAIKAVFEAMKDPSEEMLLCAERVASYGGISKSSADAQTKDIWSAMLTAFTRNHYLSELAQEDGREL